MWEDSPAARGKCRAATKGDGPRCGRGAPTKERNAKRSPGKVNKQRGGTIQWMVPPNAFVFPHASRHRRRSSKKAACSHQSSMIRNMQNRICPETAAYPVLFCPAAIPLSAPIAPGIPGLREKVGQQRYILFSLTSAAIFKIRIWVLPSGISLSITICTALSSGMRSTSRNSSSSGSISP